MSEWVRSELRQLASFQKGRKVEVQKYPATGFAPYLGAAALSGAATEYAATHNAVMADPSHVLMLWDGERAGLVGKGQDGVVSSTVSRLTPHAEVDGAFLYYALDRKFDWIQGIRTGTGVPHVPKDIGRILHLDHPVDPVEQTRIAEVISSIDDAIAQTEELIAKTQQIKAGLMHDLFTRGVTADGQLRPPREDAPEFYEDSPLGWVPRGWSAPRLESLLAETAVPMRSGPFGSALLKEELVESGIPLLGIDNVHPEKFVPTYRRFVPLRKFAELRRYAVFPGDVIITIMGTVGRCCVYPGDAGPALSSKHLWTMTFDQSQVLPELVCWQLGFSAWVRTWFLRHSQGGVMEAIQSSTLRNVRLRVPPLPEQERIRERYMSLNALLHAEERSLGKLRRRRAGLMHDRLSGSVRVSEAV